MIIGLPKETKDQEYRVALTPAGAAALVGDGHRVLVERGAGAGAGFGDDAYAASGATLVASPAAVFGGADMVVKVKEPLEPEFVYLRPGLVLFTYLHLAAAQEAARALLDGSVTAIAYETVAGSDGSLPLLTPMSEVAGRMAGQVGAHYLERPSGGSGRLLGGVTGVPPARVAVLGAGVVGTNAAAAALGLGAHVTLLNRGVDRLRHAEDVLGGDLETVVMTPAAVEGVVADADLVVGAVLTPGAAAPKVVTRDTVARMRSGSVIVDVAVDQGGCIETTRPTSHSDPVYVVDGVIHYCVTNMPGAVPYTSTVALTNATLPYIRAIAKRGVADAMREDPGLAAGLNAHAGAITHPAVAEALGVTYVGWETALA